MFAEEKARGICLALIKISVYIRRPEFRHRLEGLSFGLLEQIATHDFIGFYRTIAALEAYVRFGKTIYEIEPVNATTVMAEIAKLKELVSKVADFSLPDMDQLSYSGNAMISHPNLFESGNQQAGIAKDPAIAEIRTIESGNRAPGKAGNITNVAGKRRPALPAIAGNNAAIAENKTGNQPVIGPDNAAVRQAAITDKIRQSGNGTMKFKDVAVAFPGVSERTLRYDLQRLSSQGIIERVGEGGYYKIRVI